MANALISGTEPVIVPAPDAAPVSASEMVPTWGYEIKTGAAKRFELAAGDKLPAGYADSPDKTQAAEPTEANTKPDSEVRNGDDTAGA
jgi:hypothetical protein